MKFSTLVATLSVPALSLAIGCLNEDLDHDPLNITAARAKRSLIDLRTRDTITIKFYSNILVSTSNHNDYGAMNTAQVQYLNKVFGAWGYQFDPQPMQYIFNDDWAKDIDNDKENKMHALHRGDYGTLNVYYVEGAGGGVCSLPDGSGGALSQDQLDADGCFIPLVKPDETVGGTLTHEVGHWFGLYHVFQGGCEDANGGDYCDDTAPQKEPSYSKQSVPEMNICPVKQSCSDLQWDNTYNFMDYTDCSEEFTPCQGGRMHTTWTDFRNGRQLADGVAVTW